MLSSVDSSYFHSEESKEVYDSCRKYLGETGESPSYRLIIEDPHVSTEAREFFRESSQVITTTREAERAVRILSKYRQARGLYNLAAHIGDKIKASKVDISELSQQVTDAVVAINSKKSSQDSFLHFGKNNNSRSEVKSLLYDDVSESVIPTGIEAFDKESGGFSRGSLVTIGATSGGGKSLLANAILMNMASMGYKVLMVPLEMSKREMQARMLANLTGFDVTKILQGRLATGEKDLVYRKYNRWVAQVKRKGGRYTMFKPKEDLTIEETYAAVNAYDIDASLIDYISLLAGVDGDDQWRALGAAARYGKINAENTNRTNILLCQVGEDLKIRYARALSEHSTNSWIWTAPKVEREKDVGIIKIEQPKARNSKSFPFTVGFQWGAMRVITVDASEGIGPTPSDAGLPNLAAPDV